ncbi:MAG TPA: acyl-CoA dehydrogenase [Acidimicrobiales bacterium]|nr:acyl-CoA dehydrogenase [Acidimicrobiales bacterium]
MSIAISDDHRTLDQTVRDFVTRHGAVAAARARLEAPAEELPAFWPELAALGWLGIHLPEAYGGSGYGMPELVVVVEQLGRAVCPGPAVPTVVAGALLAACAPVGLQERYLPGLADGSTPAGVGLDADVTVDDGRATGFAPAVLGAATAAVLVVPAGDDVVMIDAGDPGVKIELPPNLDPTRRSGRLSLDGAACAVVTGGRRALTDLARLILAAEATGVARECTDAASGYARERVQFGRPIGTYQAVKHHCANMLVEAELATAAVWDAARAAAAGGRPFSYGAAMAASLASAAAVHNANLNTQVHGGIGFTWEHDAHLYLRRAAAIAALLDGEAAAGEITALARAGVRRRGDVELPPEAEEIRAEVSRFAASVRDLDTAARRAAMLETGYATPAWPRPWGRHAGAVEQLVIEQEFARAGISRPAYGITGWVILTLIQYATEDQIAGWVRPALDQEVIWCQLFSEPDAGSDAAGIKTRARRVEGGWVVNGQKVWTSGAHLAAFGLATVRTNPDAPKHEGITMMVIDMHAEGVTVRPLRQATGQSDFNEVFFNDVFVADDDVVGPVDGGWTVARATLGNESVSIGSGAGSMAVPLEAFFGPLDAHPERLAGGAGRVGRHIARWETIGILNLRSAHRAVAGGGPGPEGNLTKLLLSELGHEAAAILSALAGPDGAYLDGPGAVSGLAVLQNRALSIAGGTSEIKRNQIGERILGLPRDPLIR